MPILGEAGVGWGPMLFWSLAFVGHGALGVEVVNRVHGYGWRRKLVDAATVACGIALLAIPLAVAWRLRAEGPDAALAVGYAWLCLVGLAAIVVGRVVLRSDPHRDRLTQTTSTETLDLAERLGDRATGSATVRRLASLPGNQLLQPRVERLDVPLERLPAECEGLRVAHLTDLHMSGRLGIDYFKEAVRVVNDWSPDLVAVTGDIVEHTPQLEWVGPTLGELRARLGACFVLGNHDEKVESAELRRRLVGAGLTDLGGGEAGTIDEAQLTLCGDERPWFGGAPRLAGDEAFTLCLAHTPDRFADAARSGVDLVLAGHCHGGQVCFPLLGPLLCPSRHGVRYAAGTFRSGRTVMHVSRGTGSLFPLRYLCPPEVTLLTLRRG